jgi:hypothetical protein
MEPETMTTYDFREGQLVRLFHGVPDTAWPIYTVPNEALRAALAWNDANGDFDALGRVHLLEIFLHDFVVSRAR